MFHRLLLILQMAPWLNKLLLFVALAGLIPVASAQTPDQKTRELDYKDADQFAHFARRRKTVSAWQVHQLHSGALVVKLRTNAAAISILRKDGQAALADQKLLETAAMNKNLMLAFLKRYKFSKVYFIYSHSSDSLFNGTRSGIFIDTSLAVNPAIVMNEPFYLIAETDRIYNSTIGFVPESIAAEQTERGNPTGGDALIVIKNKYGHQLKRPFPHSAGESIVIKKVPPEINLFLYGASLTFNVGSANKIAGEEAYTEFNGHKIKLQLPKLYSPEVIETVIAIYNDELVSYYNKCSPPPETSPLYAEMKPFFY